MAQDVTRVKLNSDMVIAQIRQIRSNLNRLRNPDLSTETEMLLRCLKVSEEVGEAADALVNTFGQNFRKGKTDTFEHAAAEYVDAAVTALVAAGSILQFRYGWTEFDIDRFIAKKVTFLLDRSQTGVDKLEQEGKL